MELKQGKLTKSEWESIEVPFHQNELKIIKLIRDSYDNVNTKSNNTQSLLQVAKISHADKSHHGYFYEKYFDKQIKNYCIKYNLNFAIKLSTKIKPKKADIIRIENTDKIINENKKDIYEFILIEI